MMITKLLFVILSVVWTLDISAITKITVKGAENKNDLRYNYDTNILKLALENTKNEYGEFIIEEAP